MLVFKGFFLFSLIYLFSPLLGSQAFADPSEDGLYRESAEHSAEAPIPTSPKVFLQLDKKSGNTTVLLYGMEIFRVEENPDEMDRLRAILAEELGSDSKIELIVPKKARTVSEGWRGQIAGWGYEVETVDLDIVDRIILSWASKPSDTEKAHGFIITFFTALAVGYGAFTDSELSTLRALVTTVGFAGVAWVMTNYLQFFNNFFAGRNLATGAVEASKWREVVHRLAISVMFMAFFRFVSGPVNGTASLATWEGWQQVVGIGLLTGILPATDSMLQNRILPATEERAWANLNRFFVVSVPGLLEVMGVGGPVLFDVMSYNIRPSTVLIFVANIGLALWTLKGTASMRHFIQFEERFLAPVVVAINRAIINPVERLAVNTFSHAVLPLGLATQRAFRSIGGCSLALAEAARSRRRR